MTRPVYRLEEFLRYDAERGEVQSLVDGQVRSAIEVRKGLEDQMVLEAAVLELRRRGYTVIRPEESRS